jgi:hypothetical protein
MQTPFTYLKISDIVPVLPTTLENVRKLYPWPKNPDTGEEYSYFAHYKFDPTLIDPLFLDIMQWGGMDIKHCEVFYRPGTGEEFDAFIHVDGHHVQPCVAKINWVVGNTDNIMRFWRPIVEVESRHELITNAGTKYLTFPQEEVELIDSVDMQGVYVVNAGIPHSVDMTQGTVNEPRICVSIVPKYRQPPKDGRPADVAMGGYEVYLRLLWGAGVMNVIDRHLYINETKRITGSYPTAEVLMLYQQQCQQQRRKQDSLQNET